MTMHTDDLTRLQGCEVFDRTGDKIGKVEQIYLDQETGQPEWLAVKTGLFGTNISFVPLAEATPEDDSIRVNYEKAQVKDAPNISPDGELSQEQEATLYSHYGIAYGGSRSDSGLPEGRYGETGRGTGGPGQDTSGPNTDAAMTRSEEELKVGKVNEEKGRARLRKWVETEQVDKTVPVAREELRVEREPITDATVGAATDGPAISEEEHEIVLHQEQPVVEKNVVPKERVRLDKDTHVDEQTVAEDVRKERIELEDDSTR